MHQADRHNTYDFLDVSQGKQAEQAQSKMDTGMNSFIDVIDGVICSDLRGPMTPRDRLVSWYLVNFINHWFSTAV